MSDSDDLKNKISELRLKRHMGKCSPAELKELGALEGTMQDMEQKALDDAFARFYETPVVPEPYPEVKNDAS